MFRIIKKKLTTILLATSMIATLGCQKKEEKLAADGNPTIEANKDAIPTGQVSKLDDLNIKSVLAIQPEGAMFTDFYSSYEKRSNIIVKEDFLRQLEEFADASATQLLTNSTENLSYSPVSLYFALSVLAQGSSGETASEIFKALGMDQVDYEEIATSTDALYQLLYRDTDVNCLKVSNAVWMDQNFPFLSSYGDIVSKTYHASVFSADFSNKATIAAMQNWVKEETNGLISPEITIDSSQVMTIMNTIYYANQWSKKFAKSANTTEEFYVAEDESVVCEFLNRTDDMGSYKHGDGYKCYQLYLESGDSMIFCLPDEDQSPETLLSHSTLSEIFDLNDTKKAKIIFSLPKFDYGYKMDLVDALNNLGINKAFDRNQADFSQMSEQPLYVSTATQEVHITLDEDGVVGAAYTELGMKTSAALPEELETVELKFNRPFLYQLQTYDGIVLFTGIVANPTQN